MSLKPDPVDIHVGKRVRLRRTLLGMSQQEVGAALGLTFQQVQKYERGTNRIGSSRLYRLAGLLDVPVSYFFEDMPEEVAAHSHPASPERAPGPEPDPLAKREILELARAYHRITDGNLRRRLFELVKGVAELADRKTPGAGKPSRDEDG
ncbi:MAG: helix-turn-helix domain-containing protein [Proteobacteria bacterium]|nr:helix-turn-helix domain-containing protein [Pseudomonadota bacterium]